MRFIPTEDQLILIEKLASFIVNSDDDFIFLVKGYAGTGKTLVMGALVGALNEIGIKTVLAAPVGRAAKIMSNYSGFPATTIHKKIYRQKTVDDNFGIFLTDRNLHSDAVFIVDEASMISGESYESSNFGSGNLLDDLMSYVKSGKRCKLILSGDTAQLPPIGLSTGPALDVDRLRYYGGVVEAELKEVVGQEADSGILYNACLIRNMIERDSTSFPDFKISGYKETESINGSDLIEAVSDAYSKYGIEETIILCRSNKRAVRYNQGVRRSVLYMEEELETGDKIMIVKNNYSVKDNESFDFIANGDTARVKRIKKYREMYGMRYADVSLILEDYNSEIDTEIILDTLNMDGASLSAEKSKELFHGIAEDYSHIKDKRKRFKTMRNDRYFNALQVKFAYAVTCHKAQGGRWKCVFLDNPFSGNDVTTADLRWLYTAVTRASEKLYLVNFDKKYLK